MKLKMSGDIIPPPPHTFMAWTGVIFFNLWRPACVVNRQTFPIPTVSEHPYLSCVITHRHLNKF